MSETKARLDTAIKQLELILEDDPEDLNGSLVLTIDHATKRLRAERRGEWGPKNGR